MTDDDTLELQLIRKKFCIDQQNISCLIQIHVAYEVTDYLHQYDFVHRLSCLLFFLVPHSSCLC